ncbi:MAG: invasion associated locus B family protein [Alphaproteobacteria bacterium]|nr:MAG: invasion associated locus B family protein [Alphaproteobacteria bacterium]
MMKVFTSPRLFPLHSRLCRVAPVFLLAAVLLLPAPAPAAAQATRVKQTFGAWELNCGRPPGRKEEKCALVQSVTAEDRPNVGLTVMFLRTVDGKKQLLRVVAPLGVLLPAELGLKIDGKDIGQVPFIKCGKIGCISEVVAKEPLINSLKSGKQAIFVIFQTPEAGIGIPISLAGFTEGLKRIK